jgi:hypothetical protein
MKKLIGISTIALGLLVTSGSAFAENQIGQSLCGFTQRVMQNAGYSANATYTGSGILQLFKAINVDASKARIDPGCTYHTSFSCDVKNNLATASLCISPAVKGVHREEIISWPVTKPNYQDQEYNY